MRGIRSIYKSANKGIELSAFIGRDKLLYIDYRACINENSSPIHNRQVTKPHILTKSTLPPRYWQ